MRNLNSIHLCIAEERPEGELFRGCARPQWWPSGASWGGTFIDMLNVETLDRIIEMLLSKKMAVLAREVRMSAADSTAYVGGKIAGRAQCRHAMCKCRLQKKQSSVKNWLHGLKASMQLQNKIQSQHQVTSFPIFTITVCCMCMTHLRDLQCDSALAGREH